MCTVRRVRVYNWKDYSHTHALKIFREWIYNLYRPSSVSFGYGFVVSILSVFPTSISFKIYTALLILK